MRFNVAAMCSSDHRVAWCRSLAEQAVREKQTHTGYLEVLVNAETEERERNTIDRRIKEAYLPRVKTLDEFDYTQAPLVAAAMMRELADVVVAIRYSRIANIEWVLWH